jgi:hypothetical protein
MTSPIELARHRRRGADAARGSARHEARRADASSVGACSRGLAVARRTSTRTPSEEWPSARLRWLGAPAGAPTDATGL